MSVLEKFLKYVSFDTIAKEEKENECSNPDMLKLADQLLLELQRLNPEEISVNNFGVIDAKFNGTGDKERVAFLAHMDTSPQASDKDVKAKVVLYEGGDIKLNDDMTLTPSKNNIGHHLVITDGTTLLGGDDKAGVAIIMSALEKVLKEEHRPLEIIFTTDEEIGADAKHVTMEGVDSKYGYTIDGGDYRYVSCESFSAYSMDVEVKGVSIHPGSAKDKMVNAATLLFKFYQALPEYLRPEHTDKKTPFYHCCHIEGSEEKAKGEFIIRSFDENQCSEMIKLAEFTASRMNELLGYEAIKLKFSVQYHNMYAVLEDKKEILEEIDKVYKKNGLNYEFEAIRGGTTGSQLSFMGLPCPNLGTGDYNCHGPYEYVDVEEMEMMEKIVLDLMRK